jgi:uncharacterized protein
MLQCPRTGKPMVSVDLDGVTVDVSQGCGGVWFDNFELQKFDEAHEEAGARLLELMQKYHQTVGDLDKRLRCPRGCDAVMMRRFFSVKRHVTIDECPGCGGIWLDPGELGEIHRLFATPQEREKATKAFIEELAQTSGLNQMAQESRAAAERARQFAQMFKWICPSAYIPGQQDWGAF